MCLAENAESCLSLIKIIRRAIGKVLNERNSRRITVKSRINKMSKSELAIPLPLSSLPPPTLPVRQDDV